MCKHVHPCFAHRCPNMIQYVHLPTNTFSPKTRPHLRLTQPSCMSYISTGRAVCRWHQMTPELLLNQEKLTKFSPIQLAMVLNAIARPVDLSWRCCKTMRSGIYELNWNERERWFHLNTSEIEWTGLIEMILRTMSCSAMQWTWSEKGFNQPSPMMVNAGCIHVWETLTVHHSLSEYVYNEWKVKIWFELQDWFILWTLLVQFLIMYAD